MTKRYLTWSEIYKNAIKLTELMHSRGYGTEVNAPYPLQGIVAITRGGLAPAAILSQKMNIKTVETFALSSYDARHQQGSMKNYKELNDPEGRWLVVDDLVDTGKTIQFIRPFLPKSLFVTLYAKPQGLTACDLYGEQVDQETWLVFPWEEEILTAF